MTLDVLSQEPAHSLSSETLIRLTKKCFIPRYIGQCSVTNKDTTREGENGREKDGSRRTQNGIVRVLPSANLAFVKSHEQTSLEIM